MAWHRQGASDRMQESRKMKGRRQGAYVQHRERGKKHRVGSAGGGDSVG